METLVDFIRVGAGNSFEVSLLVAGVALDLRGGDGQQASGNKASHLLIY